MTPISNVAGNFSLTSTVNPKLNPTESISTVIFGICATLGTGITVWQGHKAWKLWHQGQGRGRSTASDDVELQPQIERGEQRSDAPVSSLEADPSMTSSAYVGAPTPPQESLRAQESVSTPLPSDMEPSDTTRITSSGN